MQYWLSAIDALITADQIEVARNLLHQGQEKGLKGDQVDKLVARIESSQGSKTSGDTLPPEKKKEILTLYSQGKFEEALDLVTELDQISFDDPNVPNIYALINSEPAMVINQISTILSSINPDVILTHDPTGGYGHPDHKTISSYTREAYLEILRRESSTQCALYFVCFPKSDFQRIWETLYELGIKPPFASENLNDLGTPDEAVTTVIDVRSYVDTKIASLNCHKTQIDPNGPFEQLPETMLRDIMSTEHYQLAYQSCYKTDHDILRNLT